MSRSALGETLLENIIVLLPVDEFRHRREEKFLLISRRMSRRYVDLYILYIIEKSRSFHVK
jgi:hypothetical protein